HSHNVMHRDLKPANILVNQDGTIRLGDFGLSREMNEDYYLTIAGTKVYMAPEVHLLKRMNKSSDMFSLGVIIFQLITGHHPYEADSEEAMIDKIKKNKVSELPDWVSNQMKEVIKWMMNNNENHRPTTKMILSHDTVLMYLRSCEDREQSKQEKIEALNERDLLIEERNQERIEKNRVIDERNRIQSDNERALAERDLLIEERNQERIEKNRVIDERNRIQSDNERALAERDRERIEKEKFKQERDQEKRRADTTQSELDKQKTKTNQSQELVSAFQQLIETTQSEVTRLTTENQHLQTELSKLRPLTTQQKQQSKAEPQHQQIQQQIPFFSNTQQSDNLFSLQQMSFVQPVVIRGDQIGQNMMVPKLLSKEQVKTETKVLQILRSVPPSLNPNMLVGIIPNKQYAYQEGLKIIRTNKYGRCSTVAFNPIISSGIVRFGGFFERHSGLSFMIGIADSSAVFGSDEGPSSGENDKKTVRYSMDGSISHIGPIIPGNSRIELNKSVSCEVNMNISPRTLTFFYDNQEQRLSVRKIPNSIRFYIYLFAPNSSFTINRFENVQYSSAKGVSNGKVFEWGKEWKK
ncbi:MAG: putative other/NEK protein kinase, partial [Streblomastix strix]